MFRIQIENDLFEIRFTYQSKLKNGKSFNGKFYLNSKLKTITFCEIVKVDNTVNNLELKYSVISSGEAQRNTSDPLDKGFGRRLALTRAIDNLKDNDYKLGMTLSFLIWEKYKLLTKDGRKLQSKKL